MNLLQLLLSFEMSHVLDWEDNDYAPQPSDFDSFTL